ncbi:MAG: phosphatidylglycerophosphatase A [Desulfobacula sp.]|nr:phosphatidylglycerophosphatase A [Desulfobacula sp.]
MFFNQKIILFMATGFFSGNIPFAPGTFGTIAAIPFVLLFLIIPQYLHAIYVTCLILAAIYVADKAQKILNKKDPGCIVIDEIAGYVVALSVVPVTIYTLAAGFLIFRFFDILKLAPVKYFENSFSGGAGIVLDDIMAGILTAVILKIIYIAGIF